MSSKELIRTLQARLDQPHVTEWLARACTSIVTVDRLKAVFFGQLELAPDLLQCSFPSLAAALYKCGELGLEPGPLGMAYIVPFNRRATLIIGYKGMIELTHRSGLVSSIHAAAVYDQDLFDFEYGTGAYLRHRPLMDGNRGDMFAAYSIARMRDGGTSFFVMSKEEVEKIRRFSKMGRSGPWVDWPEQQWSKTAVRRHWNLLPKSPLMRMAAEVDERAEMGKDVTALVGSAEFLDEGDDKRSTSEKIADGLDFAETPPPRSHQEGVYSDGTIDG